MAIAGGIGRTQINPTITPVGSPTEKVDKSDIFGETGFRDILKQKSDIKPDPKAALQQASLQSLPELKFSNHAVERMQSRGISIQPDDMLRLRGAIDKAEKKGAKETLVLMGSNALIINVKNKMVVTAMDKDMLKENVFTNIDSTVVL